jgi:hypothetical protein
MCDYREQPFYLLEDVDRDPMRAAKQFPVLELYGTKKTSCDLNQLDIAGVVPKTSASDSVVLFGKLEGKPVVLKMSLWQKDIFAISGEQDIEPLEYERAIYQRYINEILTQQVSPNFIAYVSTFLCKIQKFYRTNKFGKRITKREVGSAKPISQACLKRFHVPKKDRAGPGDSGAWGLKKQVQKQWDKHKLLEWQLCNLETAWMDLYPRSPRPSCVAFLVLESLPGPMSYQDLVMDETVQKSWGTTGIHIKRSILLDVLIQILYNLSVLEHYELHHYDMHAGNLMIQTSTQDSPYFHNHNIVYVVSPNLIYSVPVRDRFVKFFDWDWGYSRDIGPNVNLNCCKPMWNDGSKQARAKLQKALEAQGQTENDAKKEAQKAPRGWVLCRDEGDGFGPNKQLVGTQCNRFSEHWDTAHHLMSSYIDAKKKKASKPTLVSVMRELFAGTADLDQIAEHWRWGPQDEGDYVSTEKSQEYWNWDNWRHRNAFDPLKLLQHKVFGRYKLKKSDKIVEDNVFFHPSLSQAQRRKVLKKLRPQFVAAADIATTTTIVADDVKSYDDTRSRSRSRSRNRSRSRRGTKRNPFPTAKAAKEAGYKPGDAVWHYVRGNLRKTIKS